ncbi:mutL-like protein 3 [Hordeum vulgare]|uniref:MutL-like protein 3 n=1 Tax=Hordeum vulgare subsp. vulgare TaxID=112509 RepID=K9LZ36_HORVV|nr:DNA mismatch repair protein MLH3 isoform X1 [Hordeum vulgare subsp. vulgare]AFP73613.1 mutL-like protein 3 [Hordeum vulgare subsp. vulgare]KAE8781957.1 mutL-like protein 3 [Hordeum vulgare]
MQNIKRLPKSVHSSLRSSIILSDLPRVVEELVYNSIDANAKKIDVSVNVRACYVKVEDDGCGIARDELVLLGEKYATSKFYDVMGDAESSSRSFGLNGEALASLSDISVVEVRTKARGRPNSYCKIIKGSKCSHLGIDDQREAVGTTVVARELFYNQPVRRKQMQSGHKRELHNVKKCVLQIALIHPQLSVRLLDTDSEDQLLYTVPSSSPLHLISDSFGNDVSSCLHEISTSHQSWALSGHISGPTNVFCNKDFQYLYINSRFVSKSPIHNILNSLAASFQSSVTRTIEEVDIQSRKRQKTDVYPAFLLNFFCPRSSYDLHFEPSKTIVEFKDWQSILFFFEQTITNYWKKHLPQSSKGKVIDDTCVPLKSDVKLNRAFVKHQNVQNKEDDADLQQHTPRKSSVRESNFATGAATAPKGLDYFSFDMKPSPWHVCYPDRISDASEHSDNVARNDLTHFPERVSYQWFKDGSSKLEDCGLSDANPTVWKKQRMEGIFHEHAYSCEVGNFEDVQTDGLSADNQESEIMGREIDLQEPCFGVVNRPNRITCDFMLNETNINANMPGCDGLYTEFDRLDDDCLLNEVIETLGDISCPEMPHFSDGFYHEDCSTPIILKRCSRRKQLGTAAGYETNAIVQMNFPDIHGAWENDVMDMSSIKDNHLHFSHPFLLPDTPSSQSHARTGLELQGRSNKSFTYWNCENIDSDFRSTWDRSNSNSSRICEGSKHFNNLDDEPQSPNYFNRVDQFVSEDDEIPWKSKIGEPLSHIISPVKSTNGYQLNGSSSHLANNSVLIKDLPNQDNFGCDRRSRFSKGRSRSCSAPPFYKGKRKFPGLNQPQTKLTADGDKAIPTKDSEEREPAPENISHMSATQPIPETCSSEFSGLNFSLKGNLKMHEETCSGGLENFPAQITKWRDDSDQHTALELPHIPSACYDDILNISSGPLHLSSSSLVPESIDKKCFEEARVLLQLDKKFIPVISGEMLLLVDQHAADERIRLEELRSKVLSDDDRGITYLDSEKEMALPEAGFQLFQKYAEQIQKWGWIINNPSTSSHSFKKNMNILRKQGRVVTLAAVPCILGVDLTGKDLTDFIQQLDESDGSSSIPAAVLRILNYKACRGAIMFGDALLPSECSLIIEELKATSLCFQCAHGRPTTVPIVNVASLRRQLARLGSPSGRSEAEEPWHGLSQHEASLERARTRLRQLRRLRRGTL